MPSSPDSSESLGEGFIYSQNTSLPQTSTLQYLQSRKPFKDKQSRDSSTEPPPPHSEHDTRSTDSGSTYTVQYLTARAVRIYRIMAPRNTPSPQSDMHRNRLPTLFEVLSRQSLAPVDLFSFYIYMRDQQRSVDYLDFWLDVTQHMSLCRHYVRELRRSVLVDTPELEKTGSKRSSYILDHMGEMNDPSGPSVQLNTDEKVRDQNLSAFLRQENSNGNGNGDGNGNGNGVAHSPHSSFGSQQSALRGSADRSTGNERPPRASFMTSGSSPLHPTDSSSPLHTVARTDIRTSAEKILYTFLLPGSEREIILPQSILNDITASIEEDGRDDPEVFDAAKDYTFQAMERDAFPGFLRAKALGNLVPPSSFLRVVLGFLAMFVGFWVGFVLIFSDASRQVRCWVILPFTIGVYCLTSHQWDMDPILALAGVSEYTFMNWSKIHEPYVRKLLNKRATVALVVAIFFTVVVNLIFILVPGYPL